MKQLILSIAVLIMHGCFKEGTPVPVKDAVDAYKVEKIFTIDGCTVYRFEDSYTRYFTTCAGSVEWRRQSGKSSHPEAIPTADKETK